MMNVVLLTGVIFTVALNHRAKGQPCQQTGGNNAYNTFAYRHILNDNNLDRNSESSWARYLTRKGICDRVPVQSFIDDSEVNVKNICIMGGQRVVNGGNLCISASSMTVYDVKSQNLVCGCCMVTSVTRHQQRVVVACNKVGNVCLPVHYEGYKNQQPTKQNCS